VSPEDGATKEIYTEGSKAGHVYCEVPPAGCVSDNSFNGESCDVAFESGWSCGALENWNADCTGCYNCAGKTGGGVVLVTGRPMAVSITSVTRGLRLTRSDAALASAHFLPMAANVTARDTVP